MKPALLDTDTISFHLKDKGNVSAKIAAYLNEHDALNFSVISYYEIMNGLLFLDAKRQLQDFEKLVSVSRVILLDNEIAFRGAAIFAELRRNRLEISHTDVLIAATAMVNGFSVVTNNQVHFRRIDGLVMENWL